MTDNKSNTDENKGKNKDNNTSNNSSNNSSNNTSNNAEGVQVPKEVTPKVIEPQTKSKPKGKIGYMLIATTALSLFIGYTARDVQDPAKLANTNTGVSITSDVYKATVSDSPEAQMILSETIINQVFASKYADKVTDKDVEKELDLIKESYGDAFTEAINASGYKSEKEFKAYLQTQLITQAGLRANIKVTDKMLKEQWSTFVPEQEVKVATFSTDKEAKAYKKDPTNKKFTEFIVEGKAGTSNNELGLTQEALEIASSLKEGKLSDVLTLEDVTGKQYYVITSVKHVEKGSDIKPFEKELKELATITQLNDPEQSTKVLKKVLDSVEISFKDEELEAMFNKNIGLD